MVWECEVSDSIGSITSGGRSKGKCFLSCETVCASIILIAYPQPERHVWSTLARRSERPKNLIELDELNKDNLHGVSR
jgi:hypothetical protein